MFLKYSVIALCSIALCSCATHDAEGVKYESFNQKWRHVSADLSAVNRNAKMIYDTAKKGYCLSGVLFVNRLEGKKYSETIDSQAKEAARKKGIDLITLASNAKQKSAQDYKEGIETRTIVQGVQLVKQWRNATVKSGSEYNYHSTEYFTWTYNPAMAYTTIAPAAAYLGYDNVLKQLMKKGVSPFASFSNEVELSPLALAIKAHRLKTFRLLLSYTNKSSERMRDLMGFAIQEGDLRAVKLLVGKGLSVTVWINSKRTPLMYAAEYGHKDIVIYLLKKGANPKAYYETYAGMEEPNSAVALAKSNHHPEIVKILKAAICRVPRDCQAWFGNR